MIVARRYVRKLVAIPTYHSCGNGPSAFGGLESELMVGAPTARLYSASRGACLVCAPGGAVFARL